MCSFGYPSTPSWCPTVTHWCSGADAVRAEAAHGSLLRPTPRPGFDMRVYGLEERSPPLLGPNGGSGQPHTCQGGVWTGPGGGGACLKNGQPFFLSALCAEEHFLVNFCRKWPTMVLLAVFGGRGEQVRARRKALDRILVTRTLCHCTGVWGSNPPPQLPLCQTLPTSRALTMWFPSMGCPCTSVHIFHVHIMHTIFLMPTSNTQGIHSKIIV